MPAFLLMFFGGLATVTASLVGRVLVALSIGYVTYTGLSLIFAGVESQIAGMYSGVPATIVAILGLLQLDVCVNIMLSAYAARMLLMGLSPTGAITRMVLK